MAIEFIIIMAAILLGIVLLLVEIFFLPGIGIAAVLGVASTIGGIVYAYIEMGSTVGTITLLVSALIFGGLFYWMLKSDMMHRIGLKTDIDSKVDNSDLNRIEVGQQGRSISRLNPIGKVMIGDVMVEGKSFDGAFINENRPVEAIKIDGFRVIVKEIDTYQH